MASTLIVQYLGQGLAAARPATPAIDTGAIGLYAATDTGALTVYYSGAWHTVGGGYNPGTTPQVVQSAANQGGNSVTFGVAPTNGNLLVCMCDNPGSNTPGSGWTNISQVSTGTDFGLINTKTAGAGESTTQSPMSGVGTGCMVVWEISGAANILGVSNEAEVNSATSAVTPPLGFPLGAGALFLGMIGTVSASGNIIKPGGAVIDQNLNTGTSRQVVGGHATLGNFPAAQMYCMMSGASNYKAMGIILLN